MRILIDMDGVIADLDTRLTELWAQQYPNEEAPDIHNRSDFYIGTKDPRGIGIKTQAIMHAEGFFESLQPIEGAIAAVQTLRREHDVFIVTSAGTAYKYAASEKYRWVRKYFDDQMMRRLVITPAKFVVSGDILIDDKPNIYHEGAANWEHVVFDAPYNQSVTHKRRMTWNNWRKIIH